MRFFNTSGPVVSEDHYCVAPLDRINLSEILTLIADKRYFVLHAPRQTGKTSALLALRDLLNGGAHGDYRCVYVNVEPGQAARENQAEAMRAILSELELEAEATLDDRLPARLWPELLQRAGPAGVLRQVLTRWALAYATPLVLLIDEIDTLIGDTLIAVLRQLRAGYAHRPRRFPQSVILCGVRDVRDYRIHSSAEKTVITGGSAFNVKAESLRIGDFTEAEARALLGQHTAESGQPFTEEALRAVWELTAGQPWLVNSLAQQACFRNEAGRDRSRAITAEAIHEAREQLILRRETHVEQLTDKLEEERVRRVIAPVLSGSGGPETIRSDDLQYVRDLGLVARDTATPGRSPHMPPRLAHRLVDALLQAGVARQAEHIIDTLSLASSHDLFPTESPVTAHQDHRIRPALANLRHYRCQLLHCPVARVAVRAAQPARRYVFISKRSKGHRGVATGASYVIGSPLLKRPLPSEA